MIAIIMIIVIIVIFFPFFPDNFFLSGGSIHVRDMHTRESFLHILADYTHLYLSADACRIFYAMCLKVDMDYTDLNGDTALHKVVRVRGAWRPIVALMRFQIYLHSHSFVIFASMQLINYLSAGKDIEYINLDVLDNFISIRRLKPGHHYCQID